MSRGMNLDRLNPIVVKELRQGLKSRSFLIAYLGLQALMVFSMIVYFMELSNQHSRDLSGPNGFFWTMLGLIVLGFMPMRSFFAIQNEVRGQTLEMLFLTHMNSRRIANGKWMAQAIQLLMLVSAVLPYVVLRYFLGSIDLIRDLQTMGYFLGASLLLMALGTGLSSWRSKVMRTVLTGGGIFLLFTVPRVLIIWMDSSGVLLRFSPLQVSLMLILWGLVIAYFLEHGAAMIAPEAENHARPRRILQLLILGCLLGVAFLGRQVEWVWAAYVIGGGLLLVNLSQPVSGNLSVYRGKPGLRGLRLFFLPGWVSALPYSLGVLAVLWGALRHFFPGEIPAAHVVPLLFTFLYFPVLLLVLFRVRSKQWLPAYIGLHTLGMLLTLGLFIVAEVQGVLHNPLESILWLQSVAPAALILILTETRINELAAWVTWGPAAVILLLLVLLGLRPFREMLARCRQADAQG